MRLSELMNDTDVSNFTDCEIRDITCRADEVKPGWVYVCRIGTQADGHDFAQQAVDRGACAVVASRPLAVPHTVLVPDADALWPHLCARRFGHPTKRLTVIGVTGTNGKTSVCHLLSTVLTACSVKCGVVGTVENRIGGLISPSTHTTPDAYELQRLFALMVADGCTHAVMEVSSHALEQGRTAGVDFAVGIFTNLTEDHLDYHRTMSAYAQSKRRLFSQSQIAVVNADDPYHAEMVRGFRGPVHRFSIQQAADVWATDLTPCAAGTQFRLHGGGATYPVTLEQIGAFAVANALAATTALSALGFALDRAVGALATTRPVTGRGETVGFYRGARVVIDYAHTPDGLLKIGQALRPYTSGKLILLFGCGGDRDRAKRPLMGEAAASVADALIVTTDNPRSEDPLCILADITAGLQNGKTPYTVIPDREQAIAFALQHANRGDTVVLAGKGHETRQILNGRTVAFDERAIVQRMIESEDTHDDHLENHHHGDCGVRRVFPVESAR